MALVSLLSAALIALSVQGPIETPVAAEVVAPAPVVEMAAPAWLVASTSCEAKAAVPDWRQGNWWWCRPDSQYCSYVWDDLILCCVPTYVAPGAYCPMMCP